MLFSSLIDVAKNSLIIALILLACHWLLSTLFKRMQNNESYNHWIVLFFNAAYAPIVSLVWFLGLFTICLQFVQFFNFEIILNSVEEVQQLGTMLPFCWFLFRFKSLIEKDFLKKYNKLLSTFDPIVIPVFSKIATILISFFSVVSVLRILGIPLQTLMLFSGAFSIALGLAAQNLLSNFFGGLMILLNRPFCVGDWVSSPDKKVEGFVEEIGWSSTRIRTSDRRPIYVPNSMFTQIVLMNSSEMYNRHFKQTLRLYFKDFEKVDAITHDIHAMLSACEDVDKKQLILVNLVKFEEQSLSIDISAFTKTKKKEFFYKLQHELCLKVAEIIKMHGVEIAVVSQNI